MHTQPTCGRRLDWTCEEDPHVPAVAGTRSLESPWNPQAPARRQEGAGIGAPPVFVEVDREEEARFVEQHRIDAGDKPLAVVVLTGQVPAQHGLGYRKKAAVRTFRTLHSRFLADAANPFVVARGRVARLTGLRVFPPAGEDVIATPKERTKQDDLFGIRECRRSRNDVRHLRYRCWLHLNRGAPIQLLKRSKNARRGGPEEPFSINS